jgi:hypothetical protein
MVSSLATVNALTGSPLLVLGDERLGKTPGWPLGTEGRQQAGLEDPSVLPERALAPVGLVAEIVVTQGA